MLQKENIKVIHQLTPLQKGIFFQNQLDADSTAYFNQLSYRIEGHLNVSLLGKSFNEVVKRHDILRTLFVQKTTEVPLQIVLKQHPIAFDFTDATAERDKELWLSHFKQEDRLKAFEMDKRPLIRINLIQLDKEEFELLWSFHHILMDGWCVQILIAELEEIYTAFLNNRLPNLEPPISFGKYLKWLDQQDLDKAQNYWTKYLNGLDAPTNIPKIEAAVEGRFKLKSLTHQFSIEKTETLRVLAAKHQMTLNSLLQAVWALCLAKYNNSQDVVFGTIVSGRPTDIEQVENIVGLFINVIPRRIKINQKQSFLALAKQVQEDSMESKPYHFCSFASIQAQSDLKQQLINHLVVFENYPVADEIANSVPDERDLGFDISNVEFFDHSHYWFDLKFGLGEALRIEIGYDQFQYADFLIHNVFDHLEQLTNQIIVNEETLVGDLDLMSKAEFQRLMLGYNSNTSVTTNSQSVAERFETQANQYPDKPAVIFKDQELSYQQLNEKANQFAHYLSTTYDLKPDDKVAFLMDYSEYTIVVMLGILKAGAAYVPLDAKVPTSRMEQQLTVADCKTIIVDSTSLPLIPLDLASRCCVFDGEKLLVGAVKSNPPRVNTPSDLAYILFTSGSTGIPKGVMIEQGSVLNLASNKESIRLDEHTRFLQTGAISFDASTYEIWGPLLNGGAVVLIQTEELLDPERLEQCIFENKVNIMFLTAALGHRLIDEAIHVFASLKQLILGGDVLSPQHVYPLQQVYPDLAIINGYGPTENTTFSLFHRLGAQHRSSVPLGKPLSGRKAYILDAHQKLQATGCWGELYLGGAGLARGYLKDSELTAQKFIANPFQADTKLYKTGDIGRMLPEGIIEFKGRKDAQIKLRGYRIELSGIAFQLQELEGVNEAEVILHSTNETDAILVAYYTGATELEETILSEGLSQTLPSYMIPKTFVHLTAFPLNKNGKIDRTALPSPDLTTAEHQTNTKDLSSLEKELLSIWQAVLKMEQIGIKDNFFSLGGDSIQVISLVVMMKKKLAIKVKVADIFKKPTIHSLAASIEQKTGSSEDEKLKVAYQSIDQLNAQIFGKEEALKHDLNLDHFETFYPMSMIEEGMIYHSLLEKETQPYIDKLHYQISDTDFDPQRYLNALSLLVEKHSILRTGFFMSEFERPVHGIFKAEHVATDSQWTDLSHLAAPEKSTAFSQITKEVYAQQPDLKSPRLWWLHLVKMDAETYECFFCFHHAIIDGWSLVQLKKEWDLIYLELGKNASFTPDGLNYSYKDYIAEQLAQSNELTIKTWWQNYLKGFQSGSLPFNRLLEKDQSLRHKRVEYPIALELSQQVWKLSKELETGVKDIFQAAIYYLIKLTTGNQDVTLGFVTHGRPEVEDSEKIIGCFLNTIPIRYQFSGLINGQTLIKEHAALAAEIKAYERFPLQAISLAVGLKGAQSSSLFDILYGYLDFEGEDEDDDLDMDVVENFAHTDIPMEIVVSRRPDHFVLSINYPETLYTESELLRLNTYFNSILQQMVDHPEQSLVPTTILPTEEIERLESYGQPKQNLGISNETLYPFFLKNTNSNALALCWGNESWTYEALATQVQHIADILLQNQSTNLKPVGIYLQNPLWYAASILACSKINRNYVLMAPYSEADWNQMILEDVSTQLVLIDNGNTDLAWLEKNEVVLLNVEELSSTTHQVSISTENNSDTSDAIVYQQTVANRIKGIVFESKNIRAMVAQSYFAGIGNDDRILCLPNVSSTSHLLQTWVALLKGTSLQYPLPTEDQTIDALIEKYQPTVLFLEETQWNQIRQEASSPRLVYLRSQDLTQEAMLNCTQYFPNAQLVELVGPNEQGGLGLLGESSRSNTTDYLPVEQAILILDEEKNYLPLGTQGDIYIQSELLAKGYWQSETLSQDYFIAGLLEENTVKYLRSGYRGSWQADGRLHLLFALDNKRKSVPTVIKNWNEVLLPEEGLIPLNPTQRDLYFACHLNPQGKAHRLVYYAPIEGKPFNELAWEGMIQETIQQFPILQSTLQIVGGHPYLRVETEHQVNQHFIDLSHEAIKGEQALDQRIRKLTDSNHDLDHTFVQFYLLKIKDGEYINVISAHHIIFDGLSANRYFQFQQAFIERTAKSGAVEQPNAEQVLKLNQLYDSAAVIQFWKKQLDGVQAITAYASTANVAEVFSQSKYLTQAQATNVDNYCRELGISKALFFKGLFGYFLRFYFETPQKFVIREVIGNQKSHLSIGCNYSVLPVIYQEEAFGRTQNIKAYFQALRQQKKRLNTNQYISVFQINQLLGQEAVHVYYNYQSFFEFKSIDNDATHFLKEIMHYEKEEIHFLCGETADGFRLKIQGPAGVLDQGNILNRLVHLVEQITRKAETFADLQLLLPSEKSIYPWLDKTWKPTAYADQMLLHELVEAQAKAVPNQVAVRFNDDYLSYQQLNEKANQWAHYLRSQTKIEPDTLIGLMMPRGLMTIVGVLSILKAGAAYVPIDPALPEARKAYIIEDAGLELIFTEEHLISDTSGLEHLNLITLKTLLTNADSASIENLSRVQTSAHLAYMIYTSGSTGLPKGVMVRHQNIVSLLTAENNPFEFSAKDKWALFHSLSFDFSVWELFGALSHGAELVIIEEDTCKSPAAFLQVLDSQKITVLNQVPTMFKHLVEAWEEGNAQPLPSLRYLIFGGEALNPRILQNWQAAMPNLKAINMYGITETTVHVTYKSLDLATMQKGISNLGKALPNSQVAILSEQGDLLAPNMIGEIAVAGAGVTKGYYKKEALTQARFPKGLFTAMDRWYLSGDLGRYLEHGEIEYLGRKDRQVKIRGYRIEIGEIETNLLDYPELESALIVSTPDHNGDDQLIAFYKSETKIETSDLRNHLLDRIPNYMVPSLWFQVVHFPVTANGKVDDKQLLALIETQGREENTYLAPRSSSEIILAQIWKRVLDKDKIGIRDNFFEIGGHSLNATQIITRSHIEFDVQIDLRMLFTYPTVEGLAAQIDAIKLVQAVNTGDEINLDQTEEFII